MLEVRMGVNYFLIGDFSAIYLGPEGGEAKTVPLVVFPHGGPHSASANNFALEYSLLLTTGKIIIN